MIPVGTDLRTGMDVYAFFISVCATVSIMAQDCFPFFSTAVSSWCMMLCRFLRGEGYGVSLLSNEHTMVGTQEDSCRMALAGNRKFVRKNLQLLLRFERITLADMSILLLDLSAVFC